MQNDAIRLENRESEPKSQSSTRLLKAALMLFTGLAVSSASAQPEAHYRWWNPNGAPETGSMSDYSNWEDFNRPHHHPEAKNHLVFEFAQSGDCVADNNLIDYLSVSSIHRLNSATGIVRITGSPLRLRTSLPGEKCYIYSQRSYPLILETPLAGTTGLRVAYGDVELRPSFRPSHTITGGIELGDSTKLVISKSWHLGAVSNSVEMGNFSSLQFNEGMTVSIPVSAPGNGILDTNTPDTVKLTQFETGGVTQKIGQGTLSVTGIGSDSQDEWVISEGTLEANTGSIDSSLVRSSELTMLRLATDASPRRLDIRGGIDTNGYVLETENGSLYSTSSMSGDGVLRVVGPGFLSASSPTTSDIFNEFSGKMEASGGEIHLNFSGLNSTMTLCVDQPSDRVEFGGASPYTIGAIEGEGAIELSEHSRVIFGNGNANGVFSGSLESNNRITKTGTGRQDLVGTNDLTNTSIVITEGTLGLTDSAVGGASKVEVYSLGTFLVLEDLSVPIIEGSGTVEIPSHTSLKIGETDESFTFLGHLESPFGSHGIIKRGTGFAVFRASNTSDFAGSLVISDGEVRFFGGSILPATYGISIGTNGTLAGYGEITRPFTNRGRILADWSSGPMRIVGYQELRNNGTIGTESGGTIELDGLYLQQYPFGSYPAGRLEANGRSIRLVGDSPTTVHGGTIETIGTGKIELIGSAITLREVDHSGHLFLRSGVDVTAEDFDIVTGAEHTLNVEFDPDTDEADGAIRGHGTATLGGTLQVTLPDSYEPTAGDAMTVLGGDDTGEWTIDESFDSIDLPDVSPLIMRVESNTDSLRLVVTCNADLAMPFGLLDFFDISAFLAGYADQDPSADFDGNGLFDFFDVSAFLSQYSSGCS